MTESTSDPYDVPPADDSQEHSPLPADLPADAPDELRATLSGGDPEQLPTDVPPGERDR